MNSLPRPPWFTRLWWTTICNCAHPDIDPQIIGGRKCRRCGGWR